MELNDIISELEKLMDDCGLDEGWSDWLRDWCDCAETAQTPGEFDHLLHHLHDCEPTLGKLSSYPAANPLDQHVG
jgi:hypothetical protein